MDQLGIRKVVPQPFEETLARVPDALKSEGFGILTEIDVTDTLKKKLDVTFRKYRILGACNPPLAHRALTAVLDAGLMLPCNVIVYEEGPRSTVVNAVDPMQTLAASIPALEPLAREVREKLTRVLERI